ncbi:AzlD domain-containing protein [Clostridium nigeriense]|uniref:AzlD domain-containing protein n=1 Tax=Clostridium nigeriense TaxID=1805470 RepID=UPI003D32D513
MKVSSYVLIIIIGSGVVTLLPRVLPLVFLNNVKLKKEVVNWLNYIPVAVLSALLAQELLISNGQISIFNNEKLLAALPTFLVAIITKSLLGTVVVGIISMLAIKLIY